MPFGRVFHLRRETEGQPIGLVTEISGAEIREVIPGSLVYNIYSILSLLLYNTQKIQILGCTAGRSATGHQPSELIRRAVQLDADGNQWKAVEPLL